MDTYEFRRKYGALVAKAWSDEAFKQRLLEEPERVLAENGIEVPAGVEVRMVENTEKVLHLTLPAKPEQDLSEEQLSGLAGGTSPAGPACSQYWSSSMPGPACG